MKLLLHLSNRKTLPAVLSQDLLGHFRYPTNYLKNITGRATADRKVLVI